MNIFRQTRIFAPVFVSLLCLQAIWEMSAQAQSRPPEEESRIIIVKVPNPVPVAPREGYLTLYTVAQAAITLTPVTAPGGKLRMKRADQKGICIFDKLAPGVYKLQIIHDDYKPLAEEIRIERGKATALRGDPVSKYGTIVLGLGGQLAEGVAVRLNGRELTSAEFKTEKGVIIIPRAPVGAQSLALNKVGYLDWSKQIDVEPGGNLISPEMARAVIMLTVKSLPRAEVHLDNEAKGQVTEEGMLTIRETDPGKRKLRVRLDGYEEAERELTLSFEQREPIEEVALVPLADETEFSAAFDLRITEWSPANQKGWELRAGSQIGVQISDRAFALASNTSRPNRTFNIYENFRLILNLRFDNGKGAAWVTRAKDERNYYLFELDKQERKLKFYICQDGNCVLKRNDAVVADLDEEGAFYRIKLVASGNRFEHRIDTRNGNDEPLGGVIVDDAFRYGGAGLCAINGLVMSVNEFKVIPLK